MYRPRQDSAIARRADRAPAQTPLSKDPVPNMSRAVRSPELAVLLTPLVRLERTLLR